MSAQRRPLLACILLLAFAVALLLFLNDAKFKSTLESREHARHAMLADHLAKIIDARLALGLDLEDAPELRSLLTRDLRTDPRLRALATIDAEGRVQIAVGDSGPNDAILWQAAVRALDMQRAAPARGDRAALAKPLRNGFGAAAGWIVLEYDMSATRAQSREAFDAIWPSALGALLLALAVLLWGVPRLVRRHADDPVRQVRQLTLLTALLLLLVHSAIAYSAYRAFTRLGNEDAPRLAATLAQTLRPGLERALDHGIPLDGLRGVDDWMRPALADGAEFDALAVVDPNGKTLFSVTRGSAAQDTQAADAIGLGREAAYLFPLESAGRTVGSLRVTMDLLSLSERTRQLAIEFATLLAISVLVSMEVLQGLLTRAVKGHDTAGLLRLRLPLFLFFFGSELPRAFLPMWARQLAAQPVPAAWTGTMLEHLLAPFAALPDALRSTLPISLFLFSIALVSPLAGRYSARRGPIASLRVGLLLALLGNLAALDAQSLLTLCAARVAAGAGSGFATVAAFDYISRSGARASGMALYLSAYVAAGICGAGLGALVMDRAGTAAVFGVGIVCTLLAALTLAGIATPARSAAAAPALARALGRLLREPRFVGSIVLIGLPMQLLQQGLLFYWTPLALTAQGEATSFIGLTMMAYFALVLIFNVHAARWADHSGKHAAIVLGGLAAAGIGSFIGGTLYTSGAIALGVGLIGVVWAAGFPAQGALVLRLGEQSRHEIPATVTIGVYRMIERVGAMLAAPAIALAIGLLGYADTARLIGVVLFSCALLQGWIMRREAMP